MRSYILDLIISASDCSRYYSGQVKYVYAVAHSGQSVQFAARHLRPHVTKDGIQGAFRLTTDDQNRFIALERL